MARVIRFHKTGGPEVVDEVDFGAPGPGELPACVAIERWIFKS